MGTTEYNKANTAVAAMIDPSGNYAADLVDLLALIVGVNSAMKIPVPEDDGERSAWRRKAKGNEADIRWLTGALQSFEKLAMALKSGDGKQIMIRCDEAISRYRHAPDHPDGDNWTIDIGIRLLKRIKANALDDNAIGRYP